MRRRRWPWFLLGILLATSVGIGLLARPEDELAGMLRLHPQVSVVDGDRVFGARYAGTRYEFTQPPAEVAKSVPGNRGPTSTFSGIDTWDAETEIELPSGRTAIFLDLRGLNFPPHCAVIIHSDYRPWYQRVWATVRHRLGL